MQFWKSRFSQVRSKGHSKKDVSWALFQPGKEYLVVLPYVLFEDGQPIAGFQRREDAEEFLSNAQYEHCLKEYEITGPDL